MPFEDFYKKIVALSEFNLEQEISEIIKENAFYISGLLRLQLQQGKDGKGNNVTVFGRDFYADVTIQDKKYNGEGLGKETEFITNYMHGKFYLGLNVKVTNTTFESYSDVEYFDDIIRRSGSVIMELSGDHLIEFKSEILIPELKKRFDRKIHGT